jgi:FdhD protein
MLKNIEPKYSFPAITRDSVCTGHQVVALDHFGAKRNVMIAGEFPLTIKVDGQEVVTLMTLGTHPEELALGYLRNQRLIDDIRHIESLAIDWDNDVVNIATSLGKGIKEFKKRISNRTVSTGCGQGTIFSCTLDTLYEKRLPKTSVRQSTLLLILKEISKHNLIYKKSGSVHGCGLCRGAEILMFIEDVGRNNAADTISGRMWIEGVSGEDKILYMTGRLTSEIVMKAAQMRIPVLLSRSGITQMALDLAEDLGIIIIGRARRTRFLIFSGKENVSFDVPFKQQSKDATILAKDFGICNERSPEAR